MSQLDLLQDLSSKSFVHHKITFKPELADVTEGVAKNFICSVYHSCQKENPTITWNYENMQVTEWNKTLSGLNWKCISDYIPTQFVWVEKQAMGRI